MIRAPGLKAAKLLAQNEKLKVKMYYYNSKAIKLRELIGDNSLKARDLLAQERVNRKYKVD